MIDSKYKESFTYTHCCLIDIVYLKNIVALFIFRSLAIVSWPKFMKLFDFLLRVPLKLIHTHYSVSKQYNKFSFLTANNNLKYLSKIQPTIVFEHRMVQF